MRYHGKESCPHLHPNPHSHPHPPLPSTIRASSLATTTAYLFPGRQRALAHSARRPPPPPARAGLRESKEEGTVTVTGGAEHWSGECMSGTAELRPSTLRRQRAPPGVAPKLPSRSFRGVGGWTGRRGAQVANRPPWLSRGFSRALVARPPRLPAASDHSPPQCKHLPQWFPVTPILQVKKPRLPRG